MQKYFFSEFKHIYVSFCLNDTSSRVYYVCANPDDHVLQHDLRMNIKPSVQSSLFVTNKNSTEH